MQRQPSQLARVFAARLRAQRVKRRMSAEALSLAAGLSRGAVQQIESGYITDPRASTILALAQALGCSVAAFFPRANEAA